MAIPEAANENRSRHRAVTRFIPLVVLAAGLVAFFALDLDRFVRFSTLCQHRDALVDWVADRPLVAPITFMLCYAAMVAFSLPGGVSVQTSYWYPPPPRGATAGYTAPAIKWEQTTLSGLTTSPIVLTGYYSQTYAPAHHNFAGQYIFDPRLEPGLSEAVRDELAAANVAYVMVADQNADPENPDFTIWVLGVDGELRQL